MALSNRKHCVRRQIEKLNKFAIGQQKCAIKGNTKIDDKFESELALLLKENSQHKIEHTIQISEIMILVFLF